jgi:glutaredoxin-dependent peroxiredoxin
MAADVGTKAPDFTLPNQDREQVTLSTEVAKHPATVLAFFPAAFSSVCTKELCTFREGLGALNNAKAQVYGISVDTFFALKAFGDAQKLTFPLLSDFNKDVIRAYDVYNPDMVGLKGIAKRSVFVIGRDGVVKYKEVLDDARNEPNYDKLNAAVAALS